MENLSRDVKTPTLKEKVEQYEDFLHKINIFLTSGNGEGVGELIQNADNWSYAHRRGNGEYTDKQQQTIINNAFWKLLDTPESDKKTKERQNKYSKSKETGYEN